MRKMQAIVGLTLITSCLPTDLMAAEPFWQRLMTRKEAAATPAGDYVLQQEHGPWLIIASTFSGEGAESQARELAVELRREFNLKSYIHRMSFDFSDEAPARGLDNYGRPQRVRFQRDDVTEYAVLVGDFISIEDSAAQETLATIKHISPASLSPEGREKTTQNLAAWRRVKNLVIAKRSGEERGPMTSAFLTRNPLLPAEYFVPPGIDQFVEDMNKGIEYSLLENEGKYTLQVATFRGRSHLDNGSGRSTRSKKSESENPLAIAAAKAHRLTLGLRQKQWDAYEFHDRHESFVTVGSFNDPEGADAVEIATIVKVFSAGREPQNFDARGQAARQTVNAMISQQYGTRALSLYPKMAFGILFDVQPQLIPVPRRSISSAYVR